ncbi:hypothetical protein COCC4DRAFT_129263 [Bipolaris maydis ATCC 48331]|uniref:Uncharacterized protein n=2 Tax=Cochliobolus heterostrophus TaxID=5016 RepID=M2UUS0_COCH5|nr:uncharacterized protein COCC4DRAFT_129263 [Bipolaris maydis ATCC 48331]EMD91607.1 hypothetical protein COCHEDRAFT_1030399 [Bipolaris maydis C5]ENI08636.1 hypothetical protein COCC4DRAFT_129263 [Bipolaris maydis ATCC 48331]KAJ6208980.1 hypothetical protein PSV09DRAFT_1030399 [Bipolaris maydis]
MDGWRALVLPLIMGAHEEAEMQSQLGPVWQQAMPELLMGHTARTGGQRARVRGAYMLCRQTRCFPMFTPWPGSKAGEGGVEMLARRHWRAESASNKLLWPKLPEKNSRFKVTLFLPPALAPPAHTTVNFVSRRPVCLDNVAYDPQTPPQPAPSPSPSSQSCLCHPALSCGAWRPCLLPTTYFGCLSPPSFSASTSTSAAHAPETSASLSICPSFFTSAPRPGLAHTVVSHFAKGALASDQPLLVCCLYPLSLPSHSRFTQSSLRPAVRLHAYHHTTQRTAAQGAAH